MDTVPRALPRAVRRRVARASPLGPRASVWRALVAIALLPSLGLLGLSAQLTSQRLQEASSARRVQAELNTLRTLDELRIALNDEVTTSSMVILGSSLDLPVLALAGRVGVNISGSTEQTRSRTDQLLGSLSTDRLPSARLPGLEFRLARLRTVVDGAGRTHVPILVTAAEVSDGYSALGDEVSAAERAVARRVASGEQGATSAALVTQSHSLEEAVAAVTSGGRRAGLYFLQMVVPASEQPSVMARLRAEDATYRVLSSGLPDDLTGETSSAWARIMLDTQVRQFDLIVAEVLRDSARAPTLVVDGKLDLSNLSGLLPVVRAGTHVLTELSGFLGEAVQEAADTARTDDQRASDRAAQSVLFTGLLLITTAIALFTLGGVLRSRLGALAAGAKRLSAGYLDRVPVRGPRELATASEAINDAVASLHHVEAKAELLASGDLDSPDLEEPAPGPLGAAVHASVTRIVSAVREQEELRRQLAHQASHDPLTDLPNRGEIDRRLAAAAARAERAGSAVSVLFIDLDRFKACNDRLGHAAGDEVLRTVARRLRSLIRAGDSAGRLGGDEFVVITEGRSSAPGLVELGDRIVASLSEPISFGRHDLRIGASIGVASCDEGCADPDELLRMADAAVYRAKAAGGGTVQLYDQHLNDHLEVQRALHQAVAEGMQREEFVLYYQPVLHTADRRLTGAEALIRWRRPGRGLLAPDQFIPFVDGTELIADLGQWALSEATRQLVAWSGDPTWASTDVAVNISAWHLQQPRIVEDVEHALHRSGLSPERLVIEVTESTLLDNLHAVDHLNVLSQLGVRIALDGFGSGISSLSQLLHLPLDVVKIDRTLIAGVHSVRGAATGTRTATGPGTRTGPGTGGDRPVPRNTAGLVVDLVADLGHTVVAVGVEQEEQLAGLGDRCHRVQGFLICPPLPADDVTDWARARHADPAPAPRSTD